METKPEVTVKELDELIVKILAHEEKIEAKQAEITEMNKELARMESLAVQHLKDLERDEYVSPQGKVGIKEKWRVNLPQTDQDKELLFQHLRDRGIFNKYATVNSASLNSLYMADWEEAKSRGEGLEFSMPGVPAPNVYEKFDCKASKARKNAKALAAT